MICSSGVASPALLAYCKPPYSTHTSLRMPRPPEYTGPCTYQSPPSSQMLTLSQAIRWVMVTVSTIPEETSDEVAKGVGAGVVVDVVVDTGDGGGIGELEF